MTITEIADAQDPDLVTADVEDLLPETAATDLDPEIVGIDPGRVAKQQIVLLCHF